MLYLSHIDMSLPLLLFLVMGSNYPPLLTILPLMLILMPPLYLPIVIYCVYCVFFVCAPTLMRSMLNGQYYSNRKLRKYIDVCSINPLDIQIQNACKAHNITWSLSCPDDVVFQKGSTCPVYDPTGTYMKDKKLSEGVHIPEIFNFIGWGGIFLQVGFDDYLPMDEIPNNTVIKGVSSIPRPPIPLFHPLHPFDSLLSPRSHHFTPL